MPNARNLKLREQIRKLNAIGISLSDVQNLNDLLEVIVSEARHFTQADGGSLYIKENGRLNFTVAQTESLEKRDGRKEPFKSFHLPLSKKSIAGYVASTGELLNIPDVYEIPTSIEYQINKEFDVKNSYRSKSMLVVPMRDPSGSVIGVLQLINSMNGKQEPVPFKPEYESLVLSLASQAAVAIQNVKLIDEIRSLFKSLVRYSAKAIDARSPHTAGHSGRVAKYSVRIASAVNEEETGPLANVSFSPEEIEEIRMAGWLHDIGKIGVRESVLEKMNKLTDDQLEVIRERFECIKQSIRNVALVKQMKASIAGNGILEAFKQVDMDIRAQLEEIDHCFAFVKRINIPGPMVEADYDRLRAMAKCTYIDPCGRARPYLTRREHENLSIVKGNLTSAEYKEIQAHVKYTLDILDKIPFTKDLRNIPKYAAAHHEYLDGSGYPQGLSGNEIPLQARILCIADIFDALSSPDRPYKKAIPIERALEILRDEACNGKIDPDLVELFIKRKLYRGSRLEEEDD